MLRFSDDARALFRRNYKYVLLGSTVAAWFILSRELTISSLGLQPKVVHVFSIWYFATQLVIVSSNDEIANSPRWTWLRLICVITQLAGGFIYGASSTLEVSPAWAFALPVAHLGVLYEVHRSPWLAALVAALGPMLHLALAPHVTALSLGTAVAVGAVTVIVIEVLARRAAETASLDAAALIGHGELDARQRLLARVAIAMAVHDQLSGLLVGARVKLKRARAWSDVSDPVAALLGRAKALLDERPAPSGQLLESVRPAVEAHGAALDLRLEQHRPLTTAEETDLRDLVCEAGVNAARAGSPVVQLHVVVDAAGISILCRGAGAGTRAPGEGRGLRNMRLRSWARGGTFSFEADQNGSTLRVHWPIRTLALDVGVSTGALMVVLAAGPAIAQGRLADLVGVIGLSVMAAFMLKISVRFGPGAANADARDERIGAMGQVRGALTPPLLQLEAAHAGESLADADDALRTLGATFTALLADLERDALPLMPQLATGARAVPVPEPVLVFDRQHETLFGWKLIAATALTSVLLSLPQTVVLLDVPPLAYRTVNGFAFVFTLLVMTTVRQWARATWAAPLRAAALVLVGFFGASSGAMSTDTFGPGWVFFVFVPSFLGQFPLHRSRGVLAALVVTPLLTRLVFVHEASPTSLVIAAALGVACAAASYVLARQHEAIERLETGERLDERETFARGAVVDGLATAMELHDGLGGELLKLRLKLKKPQPWPEVEPSLRRVLERGTELLAGEARQLSALPDVMRSVAVAAGRDVSVELEGAASGLAPREVVDVWSIVRRFVVDAIELVPSPLSVRVRVLPRRVELVFVAAPELLAPEARPTRNAKLRLWARGGTWTRASHDRAVLSWSRRAPLALKSFAAGVAALALSLAGGYAAVSGRFWALGVTAAMSALAFFVFRDVDLRRQALARRLEALRREESAGALTVARTRLEPMLEALDRAGTEASLPAAADAARALGEALVETVRALEEQPLQALGPMNPVPASPLR